MTTNKRPVFSFINHTGCYNRGCEAIVRGSLKILQSRWPEATYILYSDRPANDKEVLKDLPSLTVLPAKYPRKTVRWFIHEVMHRVPQRGYLNRLHPVMREHNHVALSIGGDMYTLDYGFPERVLRTDLYHRISGKQLVIWGASIGPFSDKPALEERMREHLSKAALLTVREARTKAYLQSIGISNNVIQVSDPAFVLDPAPVPPELDDVFGQHRVLGFNVSPLIARWREDNNKNALAQECANFVCHAIDSGYFVLLIPHVIEKGIESRDDESFLQSIFSSIDSRVRSHVRLVHGHKYNATELKGIISQCHFFIGARTHSTIASLSSQVPTVSIAYSQKAWGINYEIFGHDRYVLETPRVSTQTLAAMLDLLESEEDEIRIGLAKVIPKQKQNAFAGLEGIASLLSRSI